MNYVLVRSDFKGQIVKMIPKAENTFEHKYNQAKCLSITTRGYITDNNNTEVKHRGSNVRSLKQRSEGWHQLGKVRHTVPRLVRAQQEFPISLSHKFEL